MHNERVNEILSFIHKNFKQKITADIIARHMNISRSECFRCFKRFMDKSLTDYINEYRLEKAAELILKTEKNITEISSECGFGSVAYFGKLFKKYYKMTPAIYKKSQIKTENFRGNISGYDYEYWRNGGSGAMIITGNADNGSFLCEWNDVDNIIMRSGKSFEGLHKKPNEIGNITFKYSAEFNPRGDAYLSIYGWMTEPLIEWLIIEKYSMYKPPGDGNLLGTIEVDNGNYEIFHIKRKNRPSVLGMRDFEQFWSVRDCKTGRTHGTVSVSEHFREWEKLGLPMGKLYEVTLSVEGWLSSGRAIINENVIIVNK